MHQPSGFRFFRSIVAIFLVLTLVRVWLGPITLVSATQAQIPDSGLQRKEILQEIQRTNELLAEIRQLLATQTLNVRIQSADNTRADK